MTHCLKCQHNNYIISYYPINENNNKLKELHVCQIHGNTDKIKQVKILNNMRKFKDTNIKIYYFPTRECLEDSKQYFHEFCCVFDYIYDYNCVRIMDLIEHDRPECIIS